jgi:DNA polymerase III epsilon subunit-like protein/8-oxo-dGTP pyrophosphatase MutT (NUDIX family)
MSTWGDRLGVFDLETTGVDVDTSRIVSACVAVLDADGEVVSRWNWLADPGIEIPPGASAVHGITTERAQAEGRGAQLVIAEIVQTLRVLFDSSIPVTIYNAPYDLSLLDRECRRHGLEPLETVGPVIDPLVIDKAVDRYRAGKRTLEVTARLYEVPLDDAHDAGADAVAAGRVALALLRRYPDELDIGLSGLHERQEVWHAEQAASFQEYLRSKRGDDSYVADPSWPLKPAFDTNSFVDTQPIPPLPPRLGNVPVLDFSATGVLALESTRGEASDLDARRVESRAARLAAPPVIVEDPFVEADSDDEPAWIIEPSETPLITVDAVEPVAASDAVGEPEPEHDLVPGPPQAVLRIAAAIVTDHDGRCLLVRKVGTSAFMQAGGTLEPGESAVDALARELREELDLELDESTAEYLGVFRAEAANEPHTVVSAAVFAVEASAQIEAHGEIEELLWIDQLEGIEVELAPLSRDELLPLWASRRAGATLF